MFPTKKQNFFKSRKGCKDIWNAFMCIGADYSKNDIPLCPTKLSSMPKEIITWTEARTLHKKLIRKDKDYFYDAFVCFYIDDYKFDGKYKGIWSSPWNALNILKHFRGIITPDFSTYQDFPYPLKLINTYRMRAFGYWMGNQGKEVINNVRWGSEETFHYCFDGIEKHSIVAIGTVGGGPRKIVDRARFERGLKKMIEILKPHTIIVYGSANGECFDRLRAQGIIIVAFPSRTSIAFERRKQHE